METTAHRRLKHLAARFLRHLGGLAVAEEVRCPISRYRVDVAGYVDRRPRRARNEIERASLAAPSIATLHAPAQRTARWWRSEPRTVLIECKQARADFLRDCRDRDALLARRADLVRIRASIERNQICRIEPQLRRRGTSLFPELDEWDYERSRLPSYREINRRIRQLDRKLYGETKFHMIARYRLADRMFIAAPAGLIRPSELPWGWGLLECAPQCLEPESDEGRRDHPALLRVAHDARAHVTRDEHRQALLRNIAVAASFGAIEGARPPGPTPTQARVDCTSSAIKGARCEGR